MVLRQKDQIHRIESSKGNYQKQTEYNTEEREVVKQRKMKLSTGLMIKKMGDKGNIDKVGILNVP
mgnify:CR=1 FL=1